MTMFGINETTKNGKVIYVQGKFYITEIVTPNGILYRVFKVSKNKWVSGHYRFKNYQKQACMNWIEREINAAV